VRPRPAASSPAPVAALLGVPVALVALVPFVAGGCAPRRTIRITSEPPGAIVRMDDETIGTTPLRHRFYHYGVHRIVVQKDGYATHAEEVALDPVWWSRFPIDVFSEVLLPFGWRDKRKYHVALLQGTEEMSVPSLQSVIERADVLRSAGADGPRSLPDPRPVELPVDKEDEPEDDEPEGRP